MHAHNGLAQYQNTSTVGQMTDADPHKLVAMLLEGTLEKIRIARGQMERGEVAAKVRSMGSVISIVEGLRMGLDLEQGGEIAANLDNLYEYALRRLAMANASNDVAILDEVGAIIGQVDSAWQGIRDAVLDAGAGTGPENGTR